MIIMRSIIVGINVAIIIGATLFISIHPDVWAAWLAGLSTITISTASLVAIIRVMFVDELIRIKTGGSI